jgi:glucoamylase
MYEMAIPRVGSIAPLDSEPTQRDTSVNETPMLPMAIRHAGLGLALVVMFVCQATEAAAPSAFPAWLVEQEQLSWRHMLENISPQTPKRMGDEPPLPGVVVAALQAKDPDYYFHWVRDSAEVMHTTATAFAWRRPYTTPALFEKQFTDFLTLSMRLQHTSSKFGLGEPRFSVNGQVDLLPWSRPQFDGPALRALAVLAYLRAAEAAHLCNATLDAVATQVLATDLDFIATVWNERGYDAWEEYKADSYHTRLVQLAALEQGVEWLEQHGTSNEPLARYRDVARKLEPLLDDHWDPARGFLRSQLAIVATDGFTAKKTDLDSEVIVAVMDGDRRTREHSVLDDRVQATVAVLEDLFRTTYPVNRRNDVGLGYGRYAGDVYYGGNPWYFVTAYYASFYYRLAARLQQGADLPVTKLNLAFLRSCMASGTLPELHVDTTLVHGSPLHKAAIEAFTKKADGVMRRLRLHTPADGQLYEQFDKRSGKPASSRGIGWSHSAFLNAVFEREVLAGRGT